ncbi:hypothetical protein KAW80_03890 [Candidatus Babeliales bacterium]|nr:hypothetical protein [Candidatus Babeliales bacterium]
MVRALKIFISFIFISNSFYSVPITFRRLVFVDNNKVTGSVDLIGDYHSSDDYKRSDSVDFQKHFLNIAKKNLLGFFLKIDRRNLLIEAQQRAGLQDVLMVRIVNALRKFSWLKKVINIDHRSIGFYYLHYYLRGDNFYKDRLVIEKSLESLRLFLFNQLSEINDINDPILDVCKDFYIDCYTKIEGITFFWNKIAKDLNSEELLALRQLDEKVFWKLPNFDIILECYKHISENNIVYAGAYHTESAFKILVKHFGAKLVAKFDAKKKNFTFNTYQPLKSKAWEILAESPQETYNRYLKKG